jgi:hypothetical protein
MKPLSQTIEEAMAIRGIVDLLETGPATTHEIALTQHLGTDQAQRLCKKLQGAGVIAHPTATRIIFGVPQQVPQMEWQLTTAYCQRGEEMPSAEELAGGV